MCQHTPHVLIIRVDAIVSVHASMNAALDHSQQRPAPPPRCIQQTAKAERTETRVCRAVFVVRAGRRSLPPATHAARTEQTGRPARGHGDARARAGACASERTHAHVQCLLQCTAYRVEKPRHGTNTCMRGDWRNKDMGTERHGEKEAAREKEKIRSRLWGRDSETTRDHTRW